MLFLAHAESGNALFAMFDNNVINWLVLVGCVVYLWAKLMPGVFASRKSSIETAIAEAQAARREGEEFLAKQTERLEKAEHEAESIIVEAKKIAEQMKAEAISQAEKEMSDFKHKIEQQIENERNMAVNELKGVAAKSAIVLAESVLSEKLTSQSKERLMNQFFEQLESSLAGKQSSKNGRASAGHLGKSKEKVEAK